MYVVFAYLICFLVVVYKINLMLNHESGPGSRVLLWIVYFSHAVNKVYFRLGSSKFVCNFLKSHSKHDMGGELRG